MKSSLKCNTCHTTKPIKDFAINHQKYPLHRCRDCNNQIRREKWLEARLGNPVFNSHRIILHLIKSPKSRKDLHELLGGRKDGLDKLIRQMIGEGYIKNGGWNRPLRALMNEREFLILWQEHKAKQCRKHHPRFQSAPTFYLNQFFKGPSK